MKSVKIQFVAVLVLGGVLGYVVAAGPSRLFAWAGGTSSAQAGEQDKSATAAPINTLSCCSGGSDKAQLLTSAALTGKSRTSCSSWVMTSACGISARTTAA